MASHLHDEVGYWAGWLRDRGGAYPDDFRRRLDPQSPLDEQLLVDVIERSGEYLRDGENCLLFPAGDASALAEAIRRLSRDPHLRRGLRGRGLTAANRHTATAFNRTVETELAGALEAWRDAGATGLESSGPP